MSSLAYPREHTTNQVETHLCVDDCLQLQVCELGGCHSKGCICFCLCCCWCCCCCLCCRNNRLLLWFLLLRRRLDRCGGVSGLWSGNCCYRCQASALHNCLWCVCNMHDLPGLPSMLHTADAACVGVATSASDVLLLLLQNLHCGGLDMANERCGDVESNVGRFWMPMSSELVSDSGSTADSDLACVA